MIYDKNKNRNKFKRKMDNGESTKKLKWTKPFGIYFLIIKTK